MNSPVTTGKAQLLTLSFVIEFYVVGGIIYLFSPVVIGVVGRVATSTTYSV